MQGQQYETGGLHLTIEYSSIKKEDKYNYKTYTYNLYLTRSLPLPCKLILIPISILKEHRLQLEYLICLLSTQHKYYLSPLIPFSLPLLLSIPKMRKVSYLPYPLSQSVLYALPSILLWIYYPWAKRHTNCPQFVLGFVLAWGIVIGSLAMGVEPFASGSMGSGMKPRVEISTSCLFMASVIWTMIYDTVYAHLDLKDDLKACIKSLAVL